jgi:hypothetical protein
VTAELADRAASEQQHRSLHLGPQDAKGVRHACLAASRETV